MNLEWTLEAKTDLRKIIHYIALDNVETANKYMRLVFAKFELIKKFPNIGSPTLKPLDLVSIRNIKIKPYIIYYQVRSKNLLVLRILHERMENNILWE